MKLCKPNNGLKPIETLPDIPSSFGNISNPKLSDMINLGWRVFSPCDYNESIKTTTWTDNGIYYTESITESWTQEELDIRHQQEANALEEIERNQKFYISKLKLIRALRNIGLDIAFLEYIQQNNNRTTDWNLAIALDSEDALVIDGSIALASMICPEATTDEEKINGVRKWLKKNCQPDN